MPESLPSKLAFALALMTALWLMQTAWSQERGKAPVEPRRTALGTQRWLPPLSEVMNKVKPKPKAAMPETASQAVQRAVTAHGGKQKLDSVVDATMEGTITFYSGKASRTTFPVTLMRKGTGQVQRVIKQPGGDVREGMSAAQTWTAIGGQSTPARAEVLDFLETQTVRSPRTLFDSQTRGHRLRDDGLKGNDRVLTVEEKNGRSTRYTLDGPSARVTRLDFETGRARNMFSGKPILITQSFVFSDYRVIDGVWTPFKVEHFSGGSKIEEMRFTSIRHNAALKDEVFRP